MSYPLGYDERGLQPLIIIRDINGIEQFRYESNDLVSGTPVQDFNLIGWGISPGININHGIGTIIIDDRNNELLDDTPRKRIKIKNSWEIEIHLGKDSSTIQKWFAGIIQEPKVINPSSRLQIIEITAFGWGIRTAHRISRISRTQKKLADGITLDDSDDAAKSSEIFKDVLQDTDHLAHRGLGQEDITVGDVADIDFKLSDYHRNFQSFAMLLSELSQISGAIYNVNPEKVASLRLRAVTPSGFLLTNDVDSPSLFTSNWDQSKTLYTRNQPFTWRESIIGAGYTVIHGVGGQRNTIDYSQELQNAQVQLHSSWIAIPFNPKTDNLSKIAPFLSKSGTIQKNLIVSIVGESLDTPGFPDIVDTRKKIEISAERLQKGLTIGTYFEILTDKIPITHGEKLFIVFEKYANATNIIALSYQTRTGNYYTSADGVSWDSQTGNPKVRTYNSKTIHIIAENTVARKEFRSKEKVISLSDFPDEESATNAMEGILGILGKVKRFYDPIVVSAPTTRPDLAKTLRLIDVNTGMDVTVDITGYEIVGGGYDSSNLGADSMRITVEEWL